jgi:outer membrane protein insertion porin family
MYGNAVLTTKTLIFAIIFSTIYPFLFSLEASEPVIIKEIRIQGNVRAEDDGIRIRLRARKGEPFTSAVVRDDVKSIYSMGFFDDVKADLSSDGILTYIVKERPYIKEVSIQGNSKVSNEKIEAALGIKPRTILDRDKVSMGVEKVRTLYNDQGYVSAKVDFAIAEEINNQALVILDIREGKRLLIQKISFEGNHVFSDKQLKKLMATKQKSFLSKFTGRGVLDRDILTNDIAKLSNHYYDHGYIDHKIDEPVVLRQKKGIKVVIRIQEKEEYRVGKVEVGGELVEDPEGLVKKVKITTGQIFRGSRLREDIQTLTQVYANEGFAFARVDPITRVNHQKREVDISLLIKRGPPVHFNRIIIAGNTKTRDKVIRREIRAAEQELVSTRKIRESENALNRTGYFESVSLTTKKTERPDEVNLHVDVKEGRTGSLGGGVGFNTGDGIMLRANAAEKNLFGRGHHVEASFDISKSRHDFILSFTEPYFRDTRVSLGVNAFNSSVEFDDFDSNRTGFGTTASYPMRYLEAPFLRRWLPREGKKRAGELPPSMIDRMRWGMSYRLVNDDVTEISDNASEEVRSESGDSLISSVTPSLMYNSLNSSFLPSKGTQSRTAFRFAGLGGDNRFIKTDFKARWFHTLLNNPRWGGAYVLSLRGALGLSTVFARPNDSDSLPLGQRYFPGNPSVRGYESRSLGPKDVNGEVIGGDKQLVTSIELRFPLLKRFGLNGVTFFDSGQAFRQSDSIDISEMRRSAGVGVRWLSPFGPLAVDFAFALNSEPEDETSLFNFNMGGGSF